MFFGTYADDTDPDRQNLVATLFGKLVRTMPRMTAVIRASDRSALYASPRTYTLLGFDEADLLAMNGRIFDQILPEDRSVFEQLLEEMNGPQAHGEAVLRLFHKKGHAIDMRFSGVPFDYSDKKIGRLEAFLLIGEDITEEVKAHRAFEKQRKILRETERVARIGTWEWNIAAQQVRWSDGYFEILGYPLEERTDEWFPINNYLQHVLPEEVSETRTNIDQYQDLESDRITSESRVRTKTGQILDLVTATHIIERDADGKAVFAVGSTHDVTDFKKAQRRLELSLEELQKTEKASSEFAYVASHDLQEPLRKITTFGDRLAEQLKADGQYSSLTKLYLDKMLNAAGRMQQLIKDLLSLSRAQRKAPDFQIIDLRQLLDEAFSNIEASAQKKQAVLRVEGDLPKIEGSPTQWLQVFQNLLSNAVKFSSPERSPVVRVSSRALSDDEKVASGFPKSEEWFEIEIADNGIGFDPSFSESIFSPFKRLHGRSEYEGTGIGLAICEQVAHRHQSKIWATGQPGEGATFYILLPKKQAES